MAIIGMVAKSILNVGRNRGTLDWSGVLDFCYPLAASVFERQTRKRGFEIMSMLLLSG